MSYSVVIVYEFELCENWRELIANQSDYAYAVHDVPDNWHLHLVYSSWNQATQIVPDIDIFKNHCRSVNCRRAILDYLQNDDYCTEFVDRTLPGGRNGAR